MWWTGNRWEPPFESALQFAGFQLPVGSASPLPGAGLDPRLEADLLLVLVTGLSDAVLLGHRTLAETTALVDHHLDRLTP